MSNAELNFCKDTRKHPAWKDQTLRVTKACEGTRDQPGVQATAGRQEAAGVGKGAQKAKCRRRQRTKAAHEERYFVIELNAQGIKVNE